MPTCLHPVSIPFNLVHNLPQRSDGLLADVTFEDAQFIHPYRSSIRTRREDFQKSRTLRLLVNARLIANTPQPDGVELQGHRRCPCVILKGISSEGRGEIGYPLVGDV